MSPARTPSQTIGPFYAIGLCRRDERELIAPGSDGATVLRGAVLDGAGDAIGDAVVELWDPWGRRWGRCGTEDGGEFSFVVARPSPGDGSAPFLYAFVFARGLLRHQLTRIYFPDEPANAHDPVLTTLPGERAATLIAAGDSEGLRFDVRMQGDRATVFFSH